MNYKKAIIVFLAIATLTVALFGIYSWQKNKIDLPTRQDSPTEIR